MQCDWISGTSTLKPVAWFAVGEWLTDLDNVEYSSIDMLMTTTLTKDSVWEDLGVTEQSNRVAVAQDLAAQGWNMVLYSLLSNLAETWTEYLTMRPFHHPLALCRQQSYRWKSRLPRKLQASCESCPCRATPPMKSSFR